MKKKVQEKPKSKMVLSYSEHLANLNAEFYGKKFVADLKSELQFFDDFSAYAVKDSEGRFLVYELTSSGDVFKMSNEYETPNEKDVR